MAAHPHAQGTELRDLPYAITSSALSADVYVPAAPVDAPVGIVLHGQRGSKDSPGAKMLARRLCDAGMLVVVPTYGVFSPDRFAADSGHLFGEAVAQARCAVALGRAHAVDVGADAARTVVIGESAGGLVGVVVAQQGPGVSNRWAYSGATCTADEDPTHRISAFVSWNGACFIYAPESGFHDQAMWKATDPRRYTDANPNLRLSFVLGGRDGFTPQWHKDRVAGFAAARGTENVRGLIELPTAGHNFPLASEELDPLAGIVLASVRTAT